MHQRVRTFALAILRGESADPIQSATGDRFPPTFSASCCRLRPTPRTMRAMRSPSQYRQRHFESGVLQNLMTVSWTCFLNRLVFGLKRVKLCEGPRPD
jgi:hypothetical protein